MLLSARPCVGQTAAAKISESMTGKPVFRAIPVAHMNMGQPASLG
jgi:hypothetical protein